MYRTQLTSPGYMRVVIVIHETQYSMHDSGV
jgi:hypothetical protein